MKAICVTPTRILEVREVPSPSTPPSGYINVRINSAAINHGDKTFLKLPPSARLTTGAQLENVWGVSGTGTVIEIGPDVPSRYLGRKVTMYRGLKPDHDVLGYWSEIAQVPYQTALLLPDSVDEKDYCGSLVNVVTAYAFLEQVVAEGHRGIVVTAGNSATGRALAVLAQKRGVPILIIVRGEKSKEALKSELKAEHVLSSSNSNFLQELESKAKELGATAVFDGVGGALISKMLGVLPARSSIFFYGFLSGAEKVEFSSATVMMKNFTFKRFSNFDTVAVKERLGDTLLALEECIEDPIFRTSLGKEFAPQEIEAALEYEGGRKKAVLIFSK